LRARVDDEVLDFEIDPDHRSSTRARRAVGGWLASKAFPDEHLDDWLIVVSEVITNAVVHGGTPIRVVVRWNGERVMIEVFDGNSDVLPQVLDRPPAVGGRGLFLVARLSSHWGYATHLNGKRVWATLETPA
jgi:anti-sigma regulatory factor (Ser/Thr protein kinase)